MLGMLRRPAFKAVLAPVKRACLARPMCSAPPPKEPSQIPLIASVVITLGASVYAFFSITNSAEYRTNRGQYTPAPASSSSIGRIHPLAMKAVTSATEADDAIKPRCFMDVSIGGEPAGRIVFSLAWSQLPVTSTNFHALCVGNAAGLTFKGSPFHRVIPGFMVQGGDITLGNGYGGRSVYGPKFPDEGFPRSHTKPGMLSMANSGRDTNSSQFFITLAPTPHLDGRHVVFGEVEEGMDVVEQIEAVGTRAGATRRPVVVTKSGELPPAK